MRLLVTGAAGFIGSHIAEQWAREGEVVGLDDLSTGNRKNLTGVDCELIEASILDADALGTAMRDVDAVVHLAARPSVPRSIVDPVASHEANATGTMRVLEAARANGRNPLVIVASSSSVYGANPELPKHEAMTPMPVSPYAASKLATEQYALAWQHSYGLPTLAFRFFNVFGPRQAPGHAYAAVVPAFVSAALSGEPLTVHGDGLQSRDFTYVGTVTQVILDAVRRRVTWAQPVNLAFGTRVTLLELIALIESQLGAPVVVNHVESRAGDVKHSQAKNDTMRSLFPTIEPVALEAGLEATVEWMREYLTYVHRKARRS
jgi:UDP-glucose 4-epimerase